MKTLKYILAIFCFAVLAGCAHNGDFKQYAGKNSMTTHTVVEGTVEAVRTVNLAGSKDSTEALVGSGVGALGGAVLGYKAGGGWGAVAGGALGLVGGNLLGTATNAPEEAQEIVVRILKNGNLMAVVQSGSQFQIGQAVFLVQELQDTPRGQVRGKIRVVSRTQPNVATN